MIELQFYLIPYFSAFQYERCRATFASHRHAESAGLADDACVACQRVQLAVGLAGTAVHRRSRQEAFRHRVWRPPVGLAGSPLPMCLGCSYLDEDGKLEYNWRKIAKRTLKTLNFWCVHRPWCRSALVCLQVTAVLFVPLFVVAGGRSRGSCSMAPR